MLLDTRDFLRLAQANDDRPSLVRYGSKWRVVLFADSASELVQLAGSRDQSRPREFASLDSAYNHLQRAAAALGSEWRYGKVEIALGGSGS
jgi:hypothetical protein